MTSYFNNLPGDFDEDGKVTMADAQKILAHNAINYSAVYDINGNGVARYLGDIVTFLGMMSSTLPDAPAPPQPPVVTEMLISGSDWTDPFLQKLADSGLGQGGCVISADVVNNLWVNTNQIIVRFSEQVTVDQDDLQICGGDGDYEIVGFETGTDPNGEFQAVWTTQNLVGPDRITVKLDGSVLASNSEAASPSAAGNDVTSYFNNLPGDFDEDGKVTMADAQKLLAHNASNYSVVYDINGNGVARDMGDIVAFFSSMNATLPDPPAAAAAAPTGPNAATSPALTELLESSDQEESDLLNEEEIVTIL